MSMLKLRGHWNWQAFVIAAISPFILGASVLAIQTPAPSSATGRRILGYFTQWGIYGRQYFVKNVDTSGTAARLTHITYAFANVQDAKPVVGVTATGKGDAFADYTKAFSADQSVDGVADKRDQPLKGNWNQLKKLKAKYPHLKVLISLGGWSWSGGFSDASLPQNREAFVAACIDTYITGNLPVVEGTGGPGAAKGVFDGIDIDWEYPIGKCNDSGSPCTSRPEDPQNFVALIAEFHKQLDVKGARDGKRYELSAAVSAGKGTIDKMNIEGLVPNLDYVLVMTYDFFGAWDPDGPTAHQSALYAWPRMPSDLTVFNTDFALNEWKRRGFAASKIMMGVPFYGRGWTGVTNLNNGLNQPATGPAPGASGEEPGIESYRNIKAMNHPIFRSSEGVFNWSFNGSTFWGFDDPVTIKNKAAYVKKQGFAGMFFWCLSDDTADGELIKAVADGLK